MISPVSFTSPVYQTDQTNQQKQTQQAQSTPQPVHDTVHLSSTATGDADHDGDSH